MRKINGPKKPAELRRLLETNLFIFKENLKLILFNSVDQIWNDSMQHKKLDQFIIKEINRGSFAEIIEVDEDKYMSNVISKRSIDKCNFDAKTSEIYADNNIIDDLSYSQKNLNSNNDENKSDMILSQDNSANIEKDNSNNDSNYEPQERQNKETLKNGLDRHIKLNNDSPKNLCNDKDTSRSLTYISLTPSQKHSFLNYSEVEVRNIKTLPSKDSHNNEKQLPLCNTDRHHYPDVTTKGGLSKFAKYKQPTSASLINNANNNINININIKNEKRKSNVDRRHSLQSNPATSSYKPLIDQIKRKRNLNAKNRTNKSLSLNQANYRAYLSGSDTTKHEKIGRFSIDSKKTRLKLNRS